MDRETLRSLVRFKDEMQCPCCHGDCQDCMALLEACHALIDTDRTAERLRFAGMLTTVAVVGVVLAAHACLAAAPGYSLQWFEGLVGLLGALVGSIGCYLECTHMAD